MKEIEKESGLFSDFASPPRPPLSFVSATESAVIPQTRPRRVQGCDEAGPSAWDAVLHSICLSESCPSLPRNPAQVHLLYEVSPRTFQAELNSPPGSVPAARPELPKGRAHSHLLVLKSLA